MSTPRVDVGSKRCHEYDGGEWVSARLARKLKRELAAALAERDVAKAALIRLCNASPHINGEEDACWRVCECVNCTELRKAAGLGGA